MSKRFLVASLLGLVVSLGAATQATAATSHAFGYDVFRQIDRTFDDGQANLTYQVSVGRRSALVAGFALGDDYQVYEAGFKRYNEKYLSGTFFQLGAAYWRGDVNDSDLGADLRLGYELPVNRWMVLSGAVSLLYGIDLPTSQAKGEDLHVRPHLGFKVHF